MHCPTCNVNSPQPHGTYGKQRTPRYRCRVCRKTFSPRSVKPVKAINLPDATLYRVLDCLAEGCSVRSTARLCDVTISSVLRVLKIAGDNYSQLIKIYTGMTDGPTRYSPAKLQGTIIEPWFGNPNREMVCTSHVERTNLTVRMRMRRLTRLTNAFSRKWENLKAAVALFVFSYNFRELHRSIRCTPAMAAGVTGTIWTWADLFAA